ANSERLWGIFSGGAGSLAIKGFWASSGAIGGLIAAGIGLLNVFMRGEASQQRALMRGLQEIHQQIIAFRHEVHERFDRVESALRGIAGAMQSYCNQILRNQQTLFEQQKKHIELSLRGFSVVTSMLSDMRMENQQFHARIFRELSYLVGLHEIASLQSLKESIESKVILIKDNSEMPATPERIQSMSDTLSGLKGELKRCVSSDYNGQKEFILSSGEPLQSLNSLMKRSLRSDDALGFLAEVFERMTETSLADSKIDKNQLPVTALWPNAVMQFITLSRLPQFSHFPVQSTLADIQSQYENIIRFTQHIRESKIILNLLDRHQEYLENFQLTLNHYFIDRQKKLTLTSKDEEKVSEKRMTIDDYFTEGADRSLLYKIDYNYILLTRFAELAGLSPAIQQHIAQIDKRTDLLEQAFDFNEMPKSFQASSLCDASMTAVYNYVYKYSYQREFLEHVGGHLYGAPGSEKMIFITSYMYSQDQPGAQDASTLGANEYDITTCRYTMGCNMRSHSMPAHNTERFPLSQYKKCFNTSVDHAWASTHLVTYNNNPFLIFHTGGAAYAAVYSINEAKPEEKWYHVDNSKKPPSFSVPLLFSNQNGTKPDTTCYTHIIRNKYMLETRLKWQKLSPPTIEYYAYDIIAGKWHNEPLELFSTDSRQILSELKIEDKNLNPNHFFINMVPDYGVYHKSSSLFYGIFQGGNQLRLNVYHNDIQNYFFRLRNHQPYSYTYNSTHTFPLEIKIIHQTHSELMKIDGVNRLMIPLTVTTSNDEMKLAIISFDYNNAQYVFQHFSLP
ncbi:MAG: hypothetical protein JO131_03360, partial [Gammaproteobacteria bacterium]|nr:hypothetical protein [Gammaproteobacteria bacterium]